MGDLLPGMGDLLPGMGDLLPGMGDLLPGIGDPFPGCSCEGDCVLPLACLSGMYADSEDP